MRRTLCLVGAALVAGVALAAALPARAKACETPTWFTAEVYSVNVTGHSAMWAAGVHNDGWMTHTASVTMTIAQQGLLKQPFVITLPQGSATLAWQQPAWFHGRVTNLPPGHYHATLTAAHVFQPGDPLGLLGASVSATYGFNVI